MSENTYSLDVNIENYPQTLLNRELPIIFMLTIDIVFKKKQTKHYGK